MEIFFRTVYENKYIYILHHDIKRIIVNVSISIFYTFVPTSIFLDEKGANITFDNNF